MKKVKVKFLDSIAVLADPKPTHELDKKYADKIEKMNRGREKPFSKYFVDNLIADMKKHDRYGEKQQGFLRDMAFKPGDEALIEETLAQDWEDAGVCVIQIESKKTAA